MLIKLNKEKNQESKNSKKEIAVPNPEHVEKLLKEDKDKTMREVVDATFAAFCNDTCYDGLTGLERVHRAMQLLDWHWAFTENGVPTKEEIKKMLRGLCDDVIERGCYCMDSGGFTVEIDREAYTCNIRFDVI